MKNYKYLLLVLMYSLFLELVAQERPPINIFSPVDYSAASQNWSISQSENRYIYAANNKGLLEYNGAKWNLYESPNEAKIRVVQVIDDLIYTGGYHDFGFWKKDNFGVLNYTSLAQKLEVNFLEDEEFWSILALDNSIIFQSLDRIHIYDKKTKAYNLVSFEHKITGMFKSGSNFYFQSLNNGLFRIERGGAKLVSDNVLFKENKIVKIYDYDGILLILTQDNGFYTLDKGGPTSWNISAKDILQNVSVFSSIKLRDNSYVLGTISDGIIHLSPEGDVKRKIAQANGLSNNTVLSIYEDLDNNIWLGLDNGINCINLNSPYSVYFDKTGRIGSVYTSAVYNNKLYLGTNQGLFCRSLNSNDDFQFIEATQGQVWFLKVIDNSLFCGHNNGTFIINEEKAVKISNVPGTWQIKQIPNISTELIQGNYDGLHILHKKNGQWQLRNKINGFDISSRFFEFSRKNKIFVSHEYKGVYELQLSSDLSNVISFKQDTLLDKGLNSSLIKHKNRLLYSNRKGVFLYNLENNTFKKDSLYSVLINDKTFTSAKLISEIGTNILWSFSSRGVHYLATSNLSGEQKVFTVPFPESIRKDVVGYESVTQIKDQQYLLGSTTGYVILDLNKIIDNEHVIKINQVAVNTISDNDSVKLMDKTKRSELKNSENNIKLSYSISEFLKTQQPEYRYKLEGMYDNWSDWTTNGSVLFENLPHGNYTFLVDGRVGNQSTLNKATYSFQIERPWFLTNLALGVYVLGVLLFSLFMHNVYKRYYRKQRERLIQRKTREFELKESENKQQLMRFKNDKLKEDIDNKNRELGVSTMNLIKKNEFLSLIKGELEKAEDTNSIKQVLKIIDRNLNNNDDWNLFQEAFNNADKDFLKKIKSVHPILTSNDLRLCAYLRLNLSSKEIAPLLNISPRSVEVKRYRLRKKMGLPHESSLTDYILET
ncbi:triple tyrosine motif-containing protein [uncultured Algibacter sp.]|uniref:triple tyrosine motif-containing protein n=1 Tax=uncultured Algibacter sp. TaxID=298659 RepID=UPI00262FFB99|nr:triple tyrosine motif-containing protein [uncultured Algibacter sp.]